jgi:hypothetical protein
MTKIRVLILLLLIPSVQFAQTSRTRTGGTDSSSKTLIGYVTGKGTSSSVIGKAPRGEGKYSIRLFNCDDGCRAYLNERLVGETGFGQDSGWLDISNRLGSGAAKLKFEVINRTGAIAYGIQVRVNNALVLRGMRKGKSYWLRKQPSRLSHWNRS